MAESGEIKRREFLIRSGLLAGASACSGLTGILQARAAPAVVPSNSERPLLSQGIQIGDVLGDRAIVWSRSDRAARLLVEWDLDERFRRPRLVRGPHALEDTDFTARVDLRELPAGQDVFVRVRFAVSTAIKKRVKVAVRRGIQAAAPWGGVLFPERTD